MIAGRGAHAVAVLLGQVLVLAGGVAYASAGVRQTVPSLELAVLAVALLLTSLLDVALSHGDTADTDTALLVSGMYLFGAHEMILAVLLARILVHLAVPSRRAIADLISGLSRRVAAILLCVPILGVLNSAPPSSESGVYLAVAGLGTVFALTQLVAGQVSRVGLRGDSLLRLLAGNLSLQGPLLAAGVSVAVLAVVITPDMGAWGIALTLLLLISMRQSFALLLDIRASYRATIEALTGAMEAQHSGQRGQGDRVVSSARSVGIALGWFGSRIERLGYAVLLNHYGLTVGPDDEQVAGRLTRYPLRDVAFLRPVLPVLKMLEGRGSSSVRRSDLKLAYVAARVLETHSPERGTQTSQAIGECLGSDGWLRRAENALKNAGCEAC